MGALVQVLNMKRIKGEKVLLTSLFDFDFYGHGYKIPAIIPTSH